MNRLLIAQICVLTLFCGQASANTSETDQGPFWGILCEESALVCAPDNENPGCELICPNELGAWCVYERGQDEACARDIQCPCL